MDTIHIDLDRLFDVELDLYELEIIEFQNEFALKGEIIDLDF